MLKHSILLLLSVALMLGMTAPSPAQTASPPAITVTGEANISATPDMAEIDGGVTSDGKTAREVSEANAKSMAGVMQALKGAGIAERDIRTARLALYPQSTQPRPGTAPQITSYRATNRVTVKVRDIGKVADILDTLVAAGANEIGGINFIVSEPSKLLDRARTEAIADARRKAEIYAQAAGVTLGRPLSISEEGANAPSPISLRNMVQAQMQATPVAPGEQTLRMAVSVSYLIESKP